MSSIFYYILFILSSCIRLDLTALISPADNSTVVINYVSEAAEISSAFLWKKTQSNLTLRSGKTRTHSVTGVKHLKPEPVTHRVPEAAGSDLRTVFVPF